MEKKRTNSGPLREPADKHSIYAMDKMRHDRKHLTAAEVDKLMPLSKGDRHTGRPRCCLHWLFHHGWHVSQACDAP
jgi:hypothetical protein